MDLFTTANLVALLMLALMEIVLGIDNVVFIAILSDKLPAEQRSKARKFGLLAALGTRLCLLFSISWLASLTAPLFALPFGKGGHPTEMTGQGLVLLAGGLFLIWKSTVEIKAKVEGHSEHAKAGAKAPTLGGTIAQIALLDVVFSLDSVITAVGMVNNLYIMVAAVVVAMGVMIAFADPVSEFISKNPSIKMLALSFLLLIGVLLTAEAFHVAVPKGYVYFAMAFSIGIEMLDVWRNRNEHRKLKARGLRSPACESCEYLPGAGKAS